MGPWWRLPEAVTCAEPVWPERLLSLQLWRRFRGSGRTEGPERRFPDGGEDGPRWDTQLPFFPSRGESWVNGV